MSVTFARITANPATFLQQKPGIDFPLLQNTNNNQENPIADALVKQQEDLIRMWTQENCSPDVPGTKRICDQGPYKVLIYGQGAKAIIITLFKDKTGFAFTYDKGQVALIDSNIRTPGDTAEGEAAKSNEQQKNLIGINRLIYKQANAGDDLAQKMGLSFLQDTQRKARSDISANFDEEKKGAADFIKIKTIPKQ